MSDKCRNCCHWQCPAKIRDGTKWADCYRVIGALEPNLLCCYEENENGWIEKFFDIPFDPTDVKYWRFNDQWDALYTHLTKCELPEKIRVKTYVKDDFIFDQKSGEKLGRLKLHYFQTREDYKCGFYDKV